MRCSHRVINDASAGWAGCCCHRRWCVQVCPPHSCSWGLGGGSRTSPTPLTWSCSSCSSENAPKKLFTVSLKCCCTISCPIRRQIKAIRLIVLMHRTVRAWAPLGKLERTPVTSLLSTHPFFPSSASCFLPCLLPAGLERRKLSVLCTLSCPRTCPPAAPRPQGRFGPHRTISKSPFRVVPVLADGSADRSAYPMASEVRKPSTGSSTSWLILGRMSISVVSERHTTIF